MALISPNLHQEILFKEKSQKADELVWVDVIASMLGVALRRVNRWS